MKTLLMALGAAIAVTSPMIAGRRVLRALLRHAPHLGRLVPREGCILTGLILGLAAVTLWFEPFGWRWP